MNDASSVERSKKKHTHTQPNFDYSKKTKLLLGIAVWIIYIWDSCSKHTLKVKFNVSFRTHTKCRHSHRPFIADEMRTRPRARAREKARAYTYKHGYDHSTDYSMYGASFLMSCLFDMANISTCSVLFSRQKSRIETNDTLSHRILFGECEAII